MSLFLLQKKEIKKIMSLLGIFSNQTDQEYTAKLISSINSHNVDDSCNAIAQILQTSKEINRKTQPIVYFIQTDK